MKSGSIGEIPPRTRSTSGFAARIAVPAAIAIAANLDQPGSNSGSQCDLLLGSFQIIAASIICASPCRVNCFDGIGPLGSAADVNLLFRMTYNQETGAT